jgi:choline kinase
MNIAVIFLVAGMSSRFGGKIKSLTEVGPNDESLIEISVNQAIKAGINKIIFVVGEKTEKPFKEKFGEEYKGIPIEYTLQTYDHEKRDRPWGAMDSLCSAKDLIDSPFVVCNGDDLYGEEAFRILLNHIKEKNTIAVIGYKLGNFLSKEGGVNRGILKVDSENLTDSIKENFNITKENLKEKELSEDDLCNMGILTLNQKTLEELNKVLVKFKEDHANDRKVECLLTDELGKILKNNGEKMQVYETDAKCVGITNPGDEEKIKIELKK